MSVRFLDRCKSILAGLRANRDAPARPAPNKDLSSELDELEAAFHVDDTFREPRQIEQLQRLLDRYHAKRGNSD